MRHALIHVPVQTRYLSSRALFAALCLPAIVVVGGCTNGWKSRSTAGPEIRQHAMAYDPGTKTVIAYGGTDSLTQPASPQAATATWSWNGSTWAKLPTNMPNPGPLISPGMVLNTDTNRVILFGGLDGVRESNQLWSWDGTVWTELHPLDPTLPVPGPRHLHAMAYDEKNKNVVIFGGLDTGAPPPANETPRARKDLQDTWIWDGTNWHENTSMPHPSPRQGASMAYDRVEQKVILFGGTTLGLDWNNETWEWNGTEWKARSPATPPSKRGLTSMACDGTTGHVLLFGGKIETFTGGRTDYNDTYSWDGNDWKTVPAATFFGFPLALPDARVNHAMAYDANRNKMVLSGGENFTTVNGVRTGHLLRDTWER